MITLSAAAEQHFKRMLMQQGPGEGGIRMRVAAAGTPAAECALEFCEPSDLAGDEHAIECDGFTFYVEAQSLPWLEEASIDYVETRSGGQLNIKAPRIRGEIPKADAGIAARVKYIIESEINPQLAAHHGHVEMTGIDPGGVVMLRFGGGCHGCGMVDVTLKQGVEKTLRQRVPEVTAVRDETEHDKGSNPYYKKREGASAMTDNGG